MEVGSRQKAAPDGITGWCDRAHLQDWEA